MSKKKEQPIKVTRVTHTEILTYAIQHVGSIVQKEENDARELEESNPDFAKRLREQSFWRPKMKILLQMYATETGNDYGYDFDFDLD